MSSSSSQEKNSSPKYAPSRSVLDEEGRKWRICAGAAVLNSNNKLLVGERMGTPGAWQCPQGGVDATGETIVDAASRELYEEVGLVVGRDVIVAVGGGGEEDSTTTTATATATPLPCYRYETTGTDNWLTRAGFAGQELHWIIFRCIREGGNDGGDDPNGICNLSGLNGEKPEFGRVKWDDIDQVVKNMWEKKRGPYEILLKSTEKLRSEWWERCRALDFGAARWERSADLSTGVAEGLIARGLDPTDAANKANEPYVQSWARAVSSSSSSKDDDDGLNSLEWNVTTYDQTGQTPRRILKYPLGSWEEVFPANSTLFGSVPGVVKRRTAYLAEPDAIPESIAHVTTSQTPLGVEEARKYLKGDHFILRRTFWSTSAPDKGIISTEVFLRG